MGAALIGVVVGEFVELTVEGFIECDGEYLVEHVQDLHLDVCWRNSTECHIQHIFKGGQVCLAEGIQSLNLHPVLDQ